MTGVHVEKAEFDRVRAERDEWRDRYERALAERDIAEQQWERLAVERNAWRADAERLADALCRATRGDAFNPWADDLAAHDRLIAESGTQ